MDDSALIRLRVAPHLKRSNRDVFLGRVCSVVTSSTPFVFPFFFFFLFFFFFFFFFLGTLKVDSHLG